MTLVYALVDSSYPEEIRYVGKTIGKPHDRLKKHLKAADYYKSQYHVHNWIRKTLSAGRTVDIFIIEGNLSAAATTI